MSPRYVGIDATDPVDTLAWGQHWRQKLTGSLGPWQNLVEPILLEGAGPGQPRNRLDTGKPLAMALVSDPKYPGRFRDACVLPLGADPKREPGTLLSDKQIEDGCAFTRRFILSPSVDGDGLNAEAKGAVADVVLLSCHFWNHSFYGEDRKGTEHEIFNLQTAAESGFKFVGPRWLLLSSCSACHDAYANRWSALLTGGSSLRGVLGMQETFPGPGESVGMLWNVVDYLAKGQPFVAAWQHLGEKTKKYENRWVAICHREAADDKPADIAQDRLKDPTGFDIIRFDPKHNGTDVRLFNPMFSAYWLKQTRVRWDTKDKAENRLREGDAVEIVVFQAFKPGDAVTITVVCRRIDYPQPYDIRTMFELRGAVGAPLQSIKTARRLTGPRRPPLPADEAAKDTGHDSWIIPVDQETDRVKLFLHCRKPTDKRPGDGLRALKDQETILWLRVKADASKDPPINFERDGAIVASKV